MFSCKCMTHDLSETKVWYNGEYEPLDEATIDKKLDAHATHCPFKTVFSVASFPPNDVMFQGTTEDYR